MRDETFFPANESKRNVLNAITEGRKAPSVHTVAEDTWPYPDPIRGPAKPGMHAKCSVYFLSVQGTTAMALISIRYSGFVNAETCTSVLAG